jgi:hypothetical protein
MATKEYKRSDILPALLRPGMYTGDQGDRTQGEWFADAVAAVLNARPFIMQQDLPKDQSSPAPKV